MNERKNVATFAGNPITLLGEEIKVGDKARDFTALNKDLSEFKLSSVLGKVVVITAFPSIDTGVCALQATRFNQEAAKLGDKVAIVTISVDLPFALSRFCAAEGIESAVTVSDHRDLDFGSKYGFVIKELRLLERGALVIDKEGIVKHVEYCSEVTNHPDYDKVMEVVTSLL